MIRSRKIRLSRKISEKLDRVSTLRTICFIFGFVSNICMGQTISGVDEVKLHELNKSNIKNRESREGDLLGVFRGSLIQEPDQSKTMTTVTFDFRLLHKQEELLKKSYRIKLRLVMDMNKLSNGVYKDELDPANKQRFSVFLYKNNEYFRGVEPRIRIYNLTINQLALEANVVKKQKGIKEVDLTTLNLKIALTEEEEEPLLQKGFSLKFSTTDNTKSKYSGFWSWYYTQIPWLLPSLFIALIFYLVACLASTIIVKSMKKLSIVKVLFVKRNEAPFMYDQFFIFTKLQLISIASTMFMYASPWSLLLLALLLFFELFGQGIILVVVNLALDYYFHIGFELDEMYLLPIISFLFDYVCRDQIFNSKMKIISLFGSWILVLAMFAFPASLIYANWVLAFGAVFSVLGVRYENPTLVDFLSWVLLFWFFIGIGITHINLYLAMGYSSAFLQNFWSTWLELMSVQLRDLFYSLASMAMIIFLDFFLIKTRVLALIFPPKNKVKKHHSKIYKKVAKHHPGVLIFKPKRHLSLRSPTLSGLYNLSLPTSNKICFGYRKKPHISIPRFSWLTSQTNKLIDQVVYKGKYQPHLVAFLSRSDGKPVNLVVRLFNLRTKALDFTKRCTISPGKIEDIENGWLSPLALQILDNHEILIFMNSLNSRVTTFGLGYLAILKLYSPWKDNEAVLVRKI